MRHVISVHDFSVEEIVDVLDRAEGMVEIARGKATSDLLRGRVLACIFFEPSTRTRLSITGTTRSSFAESMTTIAECQP